MKEGTPLSEVQTKRDEMANAKEFTAQTEDIGHSRGCRPGPCLSPTCTRPPPCIAPPRCGPPPPRPPSTR